MKLNMIKGKFRVLLLALTMTGATAAMANTGWLLVTDNGSKFDVENVGSFVMADNVETFDVLKADGGVLVGGVKKVTFEQTGTDNAVKPRELTGSASLLSHAVNNQLTLVGAQYEADVYSAAGILVASGKPAGGTVVINVSNLPSGTYLVRSGKQTFKFIKK